MGFGRAPEPCVRVSCCMGALATLVSSSRVPGVHLLSSCCPLAAPANPVSSSCLPGALRARLASPASSFCLCGVLLLSCNCSYAYAHVSPFCPHVLLLSSLAWLRSRALCPSPSALSTWPRPPVLCLSSPPGEGFVQALCGSVYRPMLFW